MPLFEAPNALHLKTADGVDLMLRFSFLDLPEDMASIVRAKGPLEPPLEAPFFERNFFVARGEILGFYVDNNTVMQWVVDELYKKFEADLPPVLPTNVTPPTPGDWHYDDYEGRIFAGDKELADTATGDVSEAEEIANSRIMAASKALFRFAEAFEAAAVRTARWPCRWGRDPPQTAWLHPDGTTIDVREVLKLARYGSDKGSH